LFHVDCNDESEEQKMKLIIDYYRTLECNEVIEKLIHVILNIRIIQKELKKITQNFLCLSSTHEEGNILLFNLLISYFFLQFDQLFINIFIVKNKL
jgi:hypothetical protein